MPQQATVTIDSRIRILQEGLTSLNEGLKRVLAANGPYREMRPWRIQYLQFLRNQSGNLQTNINQLFRVVSTMLSHIKGPTREYLLGQQTQIISISNSNQQMQTQMKERIERDSASLQRERGI